MKIADFEIDSGRTFVIAEIGVNHDGSVRRALELVGVAKAAGADAVKLQVFSASALMHPSCRFAAYQEGRTRQADPIAMLRQYELDDEALGAVAAHARLIGLKVVATPFSPSDVARVVAIGGDAIKIASPDLVNTPLLRTALAARLPMIVSTGASTLPEIESAIRTLYGSIGSVCLLHCVSAYPVEPSDARLAWIGGLRKPFGVPAGYSDHTCEPLAGALAVAAGACVIEKHLTHDRGAPGPDHSASFDQRQFAGYVAMIRLAETLRGGDGGREILACERDVRDVSRQSLVARVPIPGGARIAAEMITTQRPGSGIPAAAIDDVCGRTAACDIDAGAMITANMIAGLNLAA